MRRVADPVVLGHRRGRARLLGLRGRGLPGRDRVRARQPGGGGALARALGAQTLRFVVLPQAVRRVIPPMLSGFVGLQKETALVSVIGPLEATRQAQIYRPRLQLHAVPRGADLHAVTIPLARFTDYLLARDGGAARRGRGGTPTAPRSRACTRPTTSTWCCGHQPRRRRARSRLPDRRVGVRESTLLRCVNLLEPIDAGRSPRSARRSRPRASTRTGCGSGSGSSSSPTTSSRT